MLPQPASRAHVALAIRRLAPSVITTAALLSLVFDVRPVSVDVRHPTTIAIEPIAADTALMDPAASIRRARDGARLATDLVRRQSHAGKEDHRASSSRQTSRQSTLDPS